MNIAELQIAVLIPEKIVHVRVKVEQALTEEEQIERRSRYY